MTKSFQVKINKIDDKLEKSLYSLLAPKGFYGDYDKKNIYEVSKKYSINKKLLISLRSQFLKSKVIEKHYMVKKFKNNLLSEYSNNSVLDLCKKYDIAPLTIMRMIILEKYNFKISENKIKKLKDNDKKQLEIALNNDITSQLNQDSVMDESIKYEQKIGRALSKKGIKYKTQEDLTEEQTEKYGYAVITPDFLFDQEINLNGENIKWMEIKNFYGSNIKYFKNKIKKQLTKYKNKWGKGCVVFRYGFNSELKFDDNVIISF